MAATAFSSREAVRKKLTGVDSESNSAGSALRLEALEAELRAMRVAFVELRQLIVEREEKGKTLIEGYRNVISDFADLFETQRNDYSKRDESLRFFLNSIEGRLKTDMRNLLSSGIDDGAGRHGWWPFRRSR